jgi:Spy/CpxP family protein refolding chaperone
VRKTGAKARLVAAIVVLCLGCVAVPVVPHAQGTGQEQPAGRAARGPAGAQRPALPPVGRGMNAMQLQQHLDAFALIQAEQQLKLSGEQYSVFAPKLIRVQTMRRRMMQERRRLLNDLNQLLVAQTPSDEAISEKTKAFDDWNRRINDELVKSYQDLDTSLTPWQRGRFRLLEEQLERRKLELLTKIGPAR